MFWTKLRLHLHRKGERFVHPFDTALGHFTLSYDIYTWNKIQFCYCKFLSALSSAFISFSISSMVGKADFHLSDISAVS